MSSPIEQDDAKLQDLSNETTMEHMNEEKPVDQPVGGFIFFGVVGLLCFNFFLQVLGYLSTCFSGDFPFYANILYGLSNNCGQLLVIFYGSRFPFSSRIYLSCTALAVILVAYPILAITSPSEKVGMSIGLFLTFGLGLFNALIQSAGFGLAGICSGKAMGYFSLGQALAGLAPWPLILILKEIYSAAGLSRTGVDSKTPSDVETACSLTALSLAAACTLLMVPYYRYGLSRTTAVKNALASLETMKHSALVQHRSTFSIIKDTLPLAMSVWFVLYVTFVVFPGEVFKWTPSFGPYPDDAFYPCMMIYVFQVFDVVGRYLPAIGLKLNNRQVKIGSLLRVCTIPLFFLASYSVSFFSNDITKIIIMAIFAASNGFVLTWCMINGPSQVHKDEMDTASYTMSFFLVNGIFFGSLTALAIQKILEASA